MSTPGHTLLALPLENTASSISYDGNAARTDFPTTFAFLEKNHLVVKLSSDAGVTWTTLTLDDQYSVAGDGDPEPGGTVTMNDPPANGQTLLIERRTAVTQEMDLQASGSLPAKSLVRALDKLTMVVQEQDRRLAAVESLANLVNVTTLAAGVLVTFDFLTTDPVQSFFPAAVPCAGGQNAIGCIVLRAQNLDDAAARFDEPPQAQWQPGNVNNIIILNFVSGLAPATNYRLKLLVLFP